MSEANFKNPEFRRMRKYAAGDAPLKDRAKAILALDHTKLFLPEIPNYIDFCAVFAAAVMQEKGMKGKTKLAKDLLEKARDAANHYALRSTGSTAKENLLNEIEKLAKLGAAINKQKSESKQEVVDAAK